MLVPRLNRLFDTRMFWRTFLFVLLVSGMLAAGAPRAHADYWGSTEVGVYEKTMMEEIARAIEGALLGALKAAAIQALNQQVGQIIGGGGSSGQALFITNYNDFLYQGPAERTELYMNDFFTMMTRGKGSSANYAGAGDRGGGIKDSFANYLITVGRNVTVARSSSVTNLEEYTASPQAMFAEGDWRAFNAFFSNLANNPFGFAFQAEQVYQNKLEQEQREALVKAQSAGGFLPSEAGGAVIAPGSVIEAAQVQVQNLPNTFLATATNPGELLAGVVSAMANKIISNLVQNGIGQVQSNIQRESGNVKNQVDAAQNRDIRSQGPGAGFR